MRFNAMPYLEDYLRLTASGPDVPAGQFEAPYCTSVPLPRTEEKECGQHAATDLPTTADRDETDIS